MDPFDYPLPKGVHRVPSELLDLRSDAEIDEIILNPAPITSEKNVFFFWHNGYQHMHPYTQRNVRAWHRRFSKQGWTMRVMDRLSGSPSNVANFLDITDPGTFPKAFIDGTIGGEYAVQHTSDLVRWPLLLKHGGVYADAGFLQIGDLDRIWTEKIANPDSQYDLFSYNCGDVNERNLANYFLAARRGNPLFLRCHRLLLALWAADGGKTSTEGMHNSPLLKGTPLMVPSISFEEKDGRKVGPDEASKMLTDYIIQGQAMTMVMGLLDEEDDWNGPAYVAKHVYGIEYMVGSQLINEHTDWDGKKAYDLMCMPLPKTGEDESPDQQKAREIVEDCLRRSFGFKLAHGFILKVAKHTLGSLWRANPGSDDVPGTYGHWLRYGISHWSPDELAPNQEYEVMEPFRTGPLLG